MKAKPDRRSRRQRRAEIEAEVKLIEYTLTGPLPSTITYEDLQMGRGDILGYLEFVTHDLAQADPERAIKEIQRAADRLKKIVYWTPVALAAAVRKHPEFRTHVELKELRQVAAQQTKDFCERRCAAIEDLMRGLTDDAPS